MCRYLFVKDHSMRHFIDLTTEQLRLLYILIPSHHMESEKVMEIVKKLETHLAVPGVKR
jgi:hypothetical protein